jgi:tRNA 2-thiocytidine biosynthesis protein TtcA
MSKESLPPVPASIRRLAGQAVAEFTMLRDGDRVLVGLSGGKDSFSLLCYLQELSRRAPISFSVAAATVDPLIPGFTPSALDPIMARLEIPYFRVCEDMQKLANEHMSGDSFCAFCSRIRRGILYRIAREEGYNVLALGQHLDDLAESFLMSAMHGGQLRTMQAHYRIDAGDLRVIRPFVYVRERQTRDFAARAGLPVVQDNCPACFALPTQREHMKALLAREEAAIPRLFQNLRQALQPLMRLQDASDRAGAPEIPAATIARERNV